MNVSYNFHSQFPVSTKVQNLENIETHSIFISFNYAHDIT